MCMFSFLFASATPWMMELGILILRVGIGVLSLGHGLPKLMGGISEWRRLGSATHAVGIYFLPVMWGFLAACAELFGGIAFILGLGTRIACIPLIGTMIVAFFMHKKNGDPFYISSFSLTLLVVFVAFLFMGSGSLSLDYYLI